MKNSKEKEVAVTVVMIIVAFFFVLVISAVQASSSDPINYGLKRSIGYASLGLAFILAAVAYAYIFITRGREKRRGKEKDEVEEVIRILKEARKIKEEIEKSERKNGR